MVIKIPEKCVDVRAEADVLVVGGAGYWRSVAVTRQDVVSCCWCYRRKHHCAVETCNHFLLHEFSDTGHLS